METYCPPCSFNIVSNALLIWHTPVRGWISLNFLCTTKLGASEKSGIDLIMASIVDLFLLKETCAGLSHNC